MKRFPFLLLFLATPLLAFAENVHLNNARSPWATIFPSGLVKNAEKVTAEPNPELLKKLDGKFVGIYRTNKGCRYCAILYPQLKRMQARNKEIFEVVVWDATKDASDRISYEKSERFPWAVIPFGKKPGIWGKTDGFPGFTLVTPDGELFDSFSGAQKNDKRLSALEKKMKAWMKEKAAPAEKAK